MQTVLIGAISKWGENSGQMHAPTQWKIFQEGQGTRKAILSLMGFHKIKQMTVNFAIALAAKYRIESMYIYIYIYIYTVYTARQ